MKSAIFEIKGTKAKTIDGWTYFEINLLKAFAIEYITFDVENGIRQFEVSFEDGVIKWFSDDIQIESYDLFMVTVYYHGMRDYSLLFYWLENEHLRKRLGSFYEEAEKCFKESAWLSFSLMCAAVFEGVLYGKLASNNGFKDLISEAFKANLISESETELFNRVREARNLVHANKFNVEYIDRKLAMDIRTTMDKVIRTFAGL